MSDKKEVALFEPTTFEELDKISQYLAKSQLVPTMYQGKPQNVAVAIMWGNKLGVDAIQAVNGITVISGKPTVYGSCR